MAFLQPSCVALRNIRQCHRDPDEYYRNAAQIHRNPHRDALQTLSAVTAGRRSPADPVSNKAGCLIYKTLSIFIKEIEDNTAVDICVLHRQGRRDPLA